MDMIEELAALKAQVGALAARVAAIENLGGRKIIFAPVEPVVMVTHPAAPATTDLPDGKELQALRVICAREYPKRVDSDGFVFGRRGTVSKQENDREWLLQFGRNILAISNMRVLDKSDKTRPSSAMSTPQLTWFNASASQARASDGSFLHGVFCDGRASLRLGACQLFNLTWIIRVHRQADRARGVAVNTARVQAPR